MRHYSNNKPASGTQPHGLSGATFSWLGKLGAVLMCVSFPCVERGNAQTIIDDDFDGAEVNGWIGIGNAQAFAEQNITQEDSVIISEVVADAANTNRGIASEASFDPSATGGFTMTFVADSVSIQPGANGYFIGLVRDNDLFHRDVDTKNFGLAFYGQDGRTVSAGGFGLVYGDNNGATPADFQLGNSDDQGDVEVESFLDGFTAEVSVDATGWSYSISDLINLDGDGLVFSGEGTWEDAGTNFDELFAAGDTWFAVGSTQVVPSTTYDIRFDRITIVGGAGGGGGGPEFQIISLDRDTTVEDPATTIGWSSSPNDTYNVEVTVNLGDWVEIEDGLPSDGDTTEFVHRLLPGFEELINAPHVYYRISK